MSVLMSVCHEGVSNQQVCPRDDILQTAVVYLTVLRQPQGPQRRFARNLAAILAFRLVEILAILLIFDFSLNHDQRFAMDAILGQNLAFDLARNLVASFAIHLAEILTILLIFDFSLNHDQQHNFCLHDTTLNHLCAALQCCSLRRNLSSE